MNPHSSFLPSFDRRSHHSIQIAAAPKDVWPHVRHIDFNTSPIARGLLALRGMGRVKGPGDLEELGFSLLGEDAPHDLTFGLIGKFWTADGNLRRFGPSEFEGFDEPGYAKAIWSFRLAEDGPAATRLTTETRVLCTDEESRRLFKRYWLVVGPFSGLIRRELLRSIRRLSETR
jgi:hypothetical protein